MIETIYFGLPYKKYKIQAFTTKDMRMPMVDEFILRLAYICKGITLNSLRTYFAFSPEELSIVLTKLISKGLANVFEDKVILTPFTLEKFDSSSKDVPTFVKLEEKIYEPTFDSSDFHLLEKQYDWAEGKLFPFKSETTTRKKESVKIEAAFTESFSRILRRQDHGKAQRYDYHETLYSIKAICPIKQGNYMFAINFVINQLGQISLDVSEKLKTESDGELIQFLKKGVNELLLENKTRQINLDLEQFLRLLDIDPFQGNLKDLATLYSWVGAKSYAFTRNTPLILGAIYTNEQIMEFLGDQIDKGKRETEKLNVFWKIPDKNKFWGTGGQPDKLIKEIIPANMWDSSSLHIFSSSSDFLDVEKMFPLSFGMTKKIHTFDNPYKRGLLGNGQIECFFIPNHVAAVLYHFDEDNNYGVLIPFGIASKTKPFQKKVAGLFKKLFESRSGWRTYEHKPFSIEKGKQSFGCRFRKVENTLTMENLENEISSLLNLTKDIPPSGQE